MNAEGARDAPSTNIAVSRQPTVPSAYCIVRIKQKIRWSSSVHFEKHIGTRGYRFVKFYFASRFELTPGSDIMDACFEKAIFRGPFNASSSNR